MNEQAPLPDAEILDRLGLPSPKRRRWGLIAIAALVIVAASAGAGYYFLRGSTATTYVTTEVARGPLVVRVSATGTLQPEDQVDVGSEISGRVDRVTVDFNDRVAKGQVLAVINTDQIRAQLAQSQAALNAAKASVLTGGGCGSFDRPTGRSGRVTTNGTSCPAARIASSAGTAHSGVPMKTTLTEPAAARPWQPSRRP